MTIPYTVPEYYRSDYGEQITGVQGLATVWWCEATWKVTRSRPLPEQQGSAVRMSAARNDREAVQSSSSGRALRNLTATLKELTGPGEPGSRKSRSRSFVSTITGSTSPRTRPASATGGPMPCRRWKAHRFASRKEPTSLGPGSRSRNARAGDYRGTLSLQADDWSAQIPLCLHVWDFALPERNHLETALDEPGRNCPLPPAQDRGGAAPGARPVFPKLCGASYQSLRSSSARSHPNAFCPGGSTTALRDGFYRLDQALTRALERYHFTGLHRRFTAGRRTFHERVEPLWGGLARTHPNTRLCSPARSSNWKTTLAPRAGWNSPTSTGSMSRRRRITRLSAMGWSDSNARPRVCGVC